MSRRSSKELAADLDDDIVDGADEQETEEQEADELEPVEGRGRGARKRESEELKRLGEALVTLRADLMARLTLPEKLLDAIREAKRLTSFGAKRRQAQYIGKLMRHLDDEIVEAVRAAIDVSLGQSAKETALLHRAEHWRDSLLADDAKLEQWLADHPGTDLQQLRALIRQARKDARDGKPGEPVRHGRAYRQIFTIVRTALLAAAQRKTPDQ